MPVVQTPPPPIQIVPQFTPSEGPQEITVKHNPDGSWTYHKNSAIALAAGMTDDQLNAELNAAKAKMDRAIKANGGVIPPDWDPDNPKFQ
jgi:hypothetical protein